MTPFGLISGYDGLVCDLDGVVVAGPTAIEHAVEAINALPVPVVFATNNASRSPHAVGEAPVSYTHLTLPTTSRRCRSRWSPYH